jgi:plastocyanin
MKYLPSLQWVHPCRINLLTSILAAFACGCLAAISAWAVGPMLAISVGPGGTLTFSPRTAAAVVNTQATWTVATGTHTVTSDEGLFDSGTLTQGGVFSFTFTKPGTYNYHCNFHVSLGMVGTIIIPGAHDFTGNGNSDIVWQDTSGNTAVWLMNARGSRQPAASRFRAGRSSGSATSTPMARAICCGATAPATRTSGS